MKIKTAKVHPYELEELACKILGLDYDAIDADTDIIEEKCIQEFEIGLDGLSEIVSRLLPLVMIAPSGLTKSTYKGFADIESGMWYVKTEVTH